MVAYRGISQTEIIPIRLGDGPLRVVITRDVRVLNTHAVDAAWAKLVAGNPRYFDGPILAVLHLPHEPPPESPQASPNESPHESPRESPRESPQAQRIEAARPGSAKRDPDCYEILARPDRFARLAVQPGVPTGVRILSVTGVLVAKDAVGREWVLMGKRSRATRVYGGMWELGPSGGLAMPSASVTSLDHDMILAHLADEVLEEAGLHVLGGQAVAIARDHKAMSDDIVFVCDVGSLEAASAKAHAENWEYEQVRWFATDSLEPFDAANLDEVIPPTRALFRALGWIGFA